MRAYTKKRRINSEEPTRNVSNSDPMETDDSSPFSSDANNSGFQTTPLTTHLLNALNAAAKDMKLLKEENEKLKGKNGKLSFKLFLAKRYLKTARKERDEARQALKDCRVQLCNERAKAAENPLCTSVSL